VAASAREPHGDVVLHSLHVAGGAAAVASLSERALRSVEPAYEGVIDEVARVDKGITGPEWVSPLRSILKSCTEALGLEFDDSPSSPLYQTASVARKDELDGSVVFKVQIPIAALRKLRRIRTRDRVTDLIDPPAPDSIGPRGSSYDGAHAPRSKTPANVAAFVLKAPALDRLLLVRSKKEGRAWELPGGAVEPGEYPWVALVREVTEESGADLFDLERKTIPLDGCEVFQGTSETEQLTPGDDADEARWVTRTEASLLTLSDLPTAVVIRGWGESRA
jgi:ADP-ribose pyrophosphatase YjhB (NUDIX family)